MDGRREREGVRDREGVEGANINVANCALTPTS